MITGAHAMFYTPKADELRAFIRDKLGFPYTDTSDVNYPIQLRNEKRKQAFCAGSKND